MIGGNSTDEFLRAHDDDDTLLDGGDSDPIIQGIDDYLAEHLGGDSEDVDHHDVTVPRSEEPESEDSGQEDDDEHEMLSFSSDGDDDDEDDALRSPFTRGSERLQSPYGDATGAQLPSSRCHSQVLCYCSHPLVFVPPPSDAGVLQMIMLRCSCACDSRTVRRVARDIDVSWGFVAHAYHTSCV